MGRIGRAVRNVCLLIVAGFLAVILYRAQSGPALSQANSGKVPDLAPSMQKAIDELRPRRTTDTTPVVVTIPVSNVSYRIPRNYLVTLGDLPIIELTAPGFPMPAYQPYTDVTRPCFASLQEGWNAGCQMMHMSLAVVMPPEKRLARFLDFYNAYDKAKPGPYGYTYYGNGDGNVEGDDIVTNKQFGLSYATYTKIHKGRIIYFECTFTSATKNGKQVRDLISCHDDFNLIDGSGIRLNFINANIEKIPEIEDYMRELMENFRIKDEHK